MSAPLLSLEDVTFGYREEQPILRGVHWALRPGESWSILGPSGSGKTTLLYLLAGLRQAQQGRVTYEGRPVRRGERAIGLMLQAYGLLPWFSVRHNIEIGMKIHRHSRKERRDRAQHWLERLDIAGVADHYPGQLSGGQRQRVALARLLALETSVLLLDEPLSAVDELTRERLQKLLWELKRDLSATTVLVTHNVEEAVLLGDHIMVITGYDPIEDFHVMRNPFQGAMPARDDVDFIKFCRDVREVLQL